MSSGNIKFINTESCSPGAHSIMGETDIYTDNCQASVTCWNRKRSREWYEYRTEGASIILGTSGKDSRVRKNCHLRFKEEAVLSRWRRKKASRERRPSDVA